MKGDPNSKKGGVTAKRYIEVLEEYLPTILEPDSIFMHDNTPIYNVYIVHNWLQEEEIELIEWLLYSPDLNPIENL
jgi:transposase